MNIHRPAALVLIILFVTGYPVSAVPFPETTSTLYTLGDEYSGQWQNADGSGFIITKETDGTLTCTGLNTKGQCNIPADLTGDDVIQLEAGDDFSVALRSDGTVVAWGNNDHGQCDVPPGLSGVVSIAVTTDSAAAVLTNGTVHAWGNNDYNQTRVPQLSNAWSISSGVRHYVVLTHEGTLVTWGGNSSGQIAITPDLAGKKVISVTAGGYHTLALTEDRTVYAWGDNSRGQSNIPVHTGIVREISAGKDYSLIYLENQTLLVYGSPATLAGEPGPGSIPSVTGTNFCDFETGTHENIAFTGSGEMLVWSWDAQVSDLHALDGNHGEFLVPTRGNLGLIRVSDKNILKHPARSDIYEKIRSSPGIHFNDLCRNLGINRGTLHHHLSALLSARKIVELEYTGKTVFFANNGRFRDPERRLLAHLKNPARRELLLNLHTHGHLRRGDLIDHTQLSTSAAAWHLKSLSDEGIIQVEKSGREAYYSLHPAIASGFSELLASTVE